VILALDDGPRLMHDEDLALGLQIITVMLGGFMLLLGRFAAILGRRMRSWQDKQQDS
jgi:hypothetical protein